MTTDPKTTDPKTETTTSQPPTHLRWFLARCGSPAARRDLARLPAYVKTVYRDPATGRYVGVETE